MNEFFQMIRQANINHCIGLGVSVDDLYGTAPNDEEFEIAAVKRSERRAAAEVHVYAKNGIAGDTGMAAGGIPAPTTNGDTQ